MKIDFYNYKIGKYNIDVSYGNNNEIIQLIVKPKFTYDNEIEMNYTDKIIIKPIYADNGGKFICNNENIIIDSYSGDINLENIALIQFSHFYEIINYGKLSTDYYDSS